MNLKRYANESNGSPLLSKLTPQLMGFANTAKTFSIILHHDTRETMPKGH